MSDALQPLDPNTVGAALAKLAEPVTEHELEEVVYAINRLAFERLVMRDQLSAARAELEAARLAVEVAEAFIAEQEKSEEYDLVEGTDDEDSALEKCGAARRALAEVLARYRAAKVRNERSVIGAGTNP